MGSTPCPRAPLDHAPRPVRVRGLHLRQPGRDLVRLQVADAHGSQLLAEGLEHPPAQGVGAGLTVGLHVREVGVEDRDAGRPVALRGGEELRRNIER